MSIEDLKRVYDFELNRPRMFNAKVADSDPEHFVAQEVVPAGVFALHKDALALQELFKAAERRGETYGATGERSRLERTVESRFGMFSGLVKRALAPSPGQS